MTPERYNKTKAVLNRRQPDLTLLAEETQKTHNVAALLRTCDSVGIYCMHAVSPDGKFPRHRKVESGTRKWVDVRAHKTTDTAIQSFRAQGLQILTATVSQDSIDYREADYTKPTALIVGSELRGATAVATAEADHCIEIRMLGMVESLNVSVAAALILFEAARQREAAGLYNASRLPEEDYRRTLFEWCYPHIARRCREAGLVYPFLDDEGCILNNPFEAKD